MAFFDEVKKQFQTQKAFLGGSFDPPHIGHAKILSDLSVHLGVKEIQILLAYDPPFKDQPTEFIERFNLLEALLEEQSVRNLKSQISIDTREAKRQTKSFTVDTLKSIQRENPGEGMTFVIGTDQLYQLRDWKGFPEIVFLCDWIILKRAPFYASDLEELFENWKENYDFDIKQVGHDEKSELFRVTQGTKQTQLLLFATSAPKVSSSDVRQAFAEGARMRIEEWVPHRVSRYIDSRLLYYDTQNAANSPLEAEIEEDEETKLAALECARLVLDKKCHQVVVLDLRRRSSLTDYFVIAGAFSDRQLQATADHVMDRFRKEGYQRLSCDGYAEGRWIVLDFGEVVVHLFLDAVREYYDLESLWKDCPKVQIPREYYSSTEESVQDVKH